MQGTFFLITHFDFFSPESALKEPSQRTFKQENKGTSTFLLLKLRIFGIYVYSILIGKHL